MNVQNQVAVVTGAGRGIGRAIAVGLAGMGVRVVLAARTSAQLEETARLIGSRVEVIPTDVRSRESVLRLIERSESVFGPVDILVNAAGLGIFGPVVDFSDEQFAEIMETNLRGVFLTSRRVLPSMIDRKTGHIINIASIAGKVGSANRAVYCASKFGLVGFTESLAEEVRQYGIRATVICPGSTDTDFSSEGKNEKARQRMLRPADIAHVVGMIITQEPNSFISEVVMRPTRKP